MYSNRYLTIIPGNWRFNLSCRIVGDNIDYTINARIQSKNNRDQSLHWTHQYAVLSRAIHPSLDNTKSQKRISDIQLVDLLPNKEVQQRLKNRWAVLVSRVICKYITPLKQLQDVVLQHIPHTYSNEMAQKSTIVSCFFIILFGDLFNLYNCIIITLFFQLLLYSMFICLLGAYCSRLYHNIQ